MTPLDQTIDK